jgi:hypothetical protein
MKMEQTEYSETSGYKIQKPGNYPEENVQHAECGKSLKSRRQEGLKYTRRVNLKAEYSRQIQATKNYKNSK